MEFIENVLVYEDYCRLRESVGWINSPNAEKSLKNSLYTIAAMQDNQIVGMGRLIGDGMYYMMVDIVVHPNYQKQGIGNKIVSMIIEYVNAETPIGGRSSLQLVAEKGKESFYEKKGFKIIPHEFCGSGMRMVIRK